MDGVDEYADVRTFDALYTSDYAAVVRLAYVLTGHRALAEELAQDAFLEAHRRWERIGRYENPGGWVRRVVTNRCISSGRRAVTEAKLIVRLSQERPRQPVLSDDAAELWDQVRALPRRQAQVVALAFVEDRSISEIAEILECGTETVRTHLRRARETLAKRLSPEHRESNEEAPDA